MAFYFCSFNINWYPTCNNSLGGWFISLAAYINLFIIENFLVSMNPIFLAEAVICKLFKWQKFSFRNRPTQIHSDNNKMTRQLSPTRPLQHLANSLPTPLSNAPVPRYVTHHHLVFSISNSANCKKDASFYGKGNSSARLGKTFLPVKSY